MATTPKGIYYPNNYNEIADIPEDMKKMAESIEEVFEDTDSDLSDIKEEQTTQNNRLNSLEVDNTTNKSDILTNKQEINNIKTEQTEQNTNISTNATNIESLQEENENLKKVISQLPQIEGQGTSITLENTIEAQFTKFDVEGNSTQDGTPSPDNEVPIKSAGDNENLFDKDNEEQFLQNLTPDNNGLIVSAQTSTTSPNYIRTIIIPCKSDANYAITRFLGGKTFFIYESDEYPTLNKQTTLLKRNNDAGKASEIIKTSSTAKYLLVKIYNTYASEYYSYDELISSIKIEKSNKASVYSPYGMGSINEKISNENIFDGIMEQGAYSGSDGTTLINSPKYIRSKNYTNVVAGETYIITIKAKGTNQTNGDIFIYNIDGTLNSSINGLLNSFTIPTGGRKIKINVFNNNNIAPSDVEFAMMNIGSTATPYVPHEEQDYSIFVQQPMRSIGDVRDCFVKKSDGWYERHYIAEGIFNPYNCGLNGGGTTRLRISMWGYQNLKETSVKSKYFPSINGRWDDNNEIKNAIYGWNSDGVIGVNIDKEIVSTLDEFKTWASKVGLNFYYIRKNPTDLPCTEEQIEALENLPSTYKDFTYVVSEDEIEAYLEVSGIRDINTMFDKVTNAIVSLGGNV